MSAATAKAPVTAELRGGEVLDGSVDDGARVAEVAPEASATSTPPKKRVGRIVVLALLATAVVAGAVQVVRVVRRPPEVLVVAVQVEDVTRMLAVTGRVEAVQTVLVSPQSSGRITEIVRHEGTA